MIDASKDIKKLFRHYYENIFPDIGPVLPELKFRHFRFQLFSKKTSFLRIQDIIVNHEHIIRKLKYFIPKNAYFTPVKWLNPINVARNKDELDIMLSFPLYFDIDMQDLDPPTFSEVKRNTCCLIQFIEDEYSRKPDLIIFSGRQGFHIYYWKWDKSDIIHLNANERILEFKRRRKAFLKIVQEKKIIVDERITGDPYRIMKIPNTLHGTTGFVAKNILDVEKFEVLKEALVFDTKDYSIFKIDWNNYL